MEMGSKDRAIKSLKAKQLLQAHAVNRNSDGRRQLFNVSMCPLCQGGQSCRFPQLPRTSIGSRREEGAVGFGVGRDGVCRSAWCRHEGHTTTPKATSPLQEVLSIPGI